MKTSPMRPTGILKSGITSIYEGHAPPISTSEPALRSNGRADDVTQEFISRRSRELVQNHTRARSTMRIYPSSQPEMPSSSQSGILSEDRSEAAGIATQIDPTEDPNLHQSTETLTPEFIDPPPPKCSHSNNDQRTGYCNTLRKFSSEKLREVTNDFSADNRFGYQHDHVFKGNFDGKLVFVARRDSDSKVKVVSEVDMLSSLCHPNIVTLIGYCDEESDLALVFEFASNRCLSFHLAAGNLNVALQWSHRANLAVHLARGLVYLHNQGIIHGNVNSLYVFLHEDFTPLIAQFSLAKRVADGQEAIVQDRSKVDRKTRGYLAPEYEPGTRLSMEQDVYAFGVVLFELVSGRPAFYKKIKLGELGRDTVENSQQESEGLLIRTLMDRRLEGPNLDKCDVLRMMKVAALCTKADPAERPSMTEVLEMLSCDLERRIQNGSEGDSEPEDEDGYQTPDEWQTGGKEAEIHPMAPSDGSWETQLSEVQLLQKMLNIETETEQSQTPERRRARRSRNLQVRWAHDPDAMETGGTQASSDHEETLRRSLAPLSDIAGKLFKEMKAAYETAREVNKFLTKVPRKTRPTYESLCVERNPFNYYQVRITRRAQMRLQQLQQSSAAGRSLRRPPTPSHRLYKTGAGYNGRADSSPLSPKSSIVRSPSRSPRRVGIPMSPMRANVITRHYQRRSWNENSSQSHGKQVIFVNNQRPSGWIRVHE